MDAWKYPSEFKKEMQPAFQIANQAKPMSWKNNIFKKIIVYIQDIYVRAMPDGSSA
jgi:hypothetical protein